MRDAEREPRTGRYDPFDWATPVDVNAAGYTIGSRIDGGKLSRLNEELHRERRRIARAREIVVEALAAVGVADPLRDARTITAMVVAERCALGTRHKLETCALAGVLAALSTNPRMYKRAIEYIKSIGRRPPTIYRALRDTLGRNPAPSLDDVVRAAVEERAACPAAVRCIMENWRALLDAGAARGPLTAVAIAAKICNNILCRRQRTPTLSNMHIDKDVYVVVRVG